MKENWGIIGHQNIIDYLENSYRRERLAHAYLFYGMQNLGKTTVALKFAQKLLGKNNGAKSDLFELQLMEDSKEIKIDQVRDWQHFLALKTYADHYKVGIIHQAEYLNEESANALLKTIEEPSSKTVIILITSSWQRLLPTIISRSQKIHFLPVPNKILEKAVREKISNVKEIREIMEFAQNRPGLAVRCCDEKDFRDGYEKLQKQVLKLFQLPVSDRLDFIDKYLQKKDNAENSSLAGEFLNNFELVVRQKMLKEIYNEDQLTPGSIGLAARLKQVLELRSLIKYNVQPKLLLENLLINL
jgi:DNA polymerase III subunit delta'